MTDRPDLVDAFSAAFFEAFGKRAIEVAERQRDRADGAVRERWQHVLNVLVARASPQP